MPGPIAYIGKISPLIKLQFKGDSVSGSKSSTSIVSHGITMPASDYPYIIANESLNEFTISGKVGGKIYKLRRKAEKGKRFYSSSKSSYILHRTKTSVLNKLLDSPASTTWKIDVKFSYKLFFYYLLEQMTLVDKANLSNIANTSGKSKILDSIKYSWTGKKVRVKYKTKHEYWKNIPLKLLGSPTITPRPGRSPIVELEFELDFLTGLSDAKKQAMRKLIAMDYSKLLRWGKYHPVSGLKSFAIVWRENVVFYLMNHTDFTRGEEIKKQIFNGSKTRTQEQISKQLRDDIDKWIVAANHWGQRRESWKTEKYQRILSDLFGAIQNKHWAASPVHFIRYLKILCSLSDEDRASLILQYGTGHCGEHATVSFDILKDIRSIPTSHVKYVVYTGNANIDHAFVIYGLDVKEVISTKVKSKRNTRITHVVGGKRKAKINAPIDVWDLRDTILKNPGKKGYVMDPYLAPAMIPRLADKLLISLNSKKQKKKKKDTHFLAFLREDPSSYTVDSRPGGVKNV